MTLARLWCQLQDEPHRMRRDGLHDVAQIHEWIDLEVLACLDEWPRLPLRQFAADSAAALARRTPQGDEEE